jgi:redox-sensing transcriptional repressor
MCFVIPTKTVERLFIYRRLITDLLQQNVRYVFSHELATLSQSSPAQVRRDLMTAGITGSSSRGYDVVNLKSRFDKILNSSVQKAALVGIGNLGRAILSYFPHRSPAVEIVAAFDSDSARTDRIIHGIRTYSLDRLDTLVQEANVSLGIITTPKHAAQTTADNMVAAGIRGILNFAPVPIRVPTGIFIESLDLTTSLEKLAYFSSKPH